MINQLINQLIKNNYLVGPKTISIKHQPIEIICLLKPKVIANKKPRIITWQGQLFGNAKKQSKMIDLTNIKLIINTIIAKFDEV